LIRQDRQAQAGTHLKGLPPRVSGALPVLGHVIEFVRSPTDMIQRGHGELGDVFSFRLPGRDAVVILGTARSRFLFSETDKLLSIGSAYPFFRRMFAPDFYFLAEDHDEYKRQQEIVLPRFQGRQLDSYVEVMEDETIRLGQQLGDTGQFNLTDVLGPLVMQIAAHSFLGSDFGAKMTRDFFTEFRKFSEGIDFFTPSWLPLPHMVRSRRSRDRLRRSLGQMISERRGQPADPPDFLQQLVEARFASGEPLPDLLLVNLLLLFTWAGHETTTGHIAWALIDLLRNPAELLRVRAEAEMMTSPMTMDQVKNLTHLDNCLHETERLHPVVHIISREATAGFDLEGYRIPKGTMVLASPAVTHRLPEEHHRPDDFWPDRYGPSREGRGERQSLIGFGGGLHRCLGVHFAYLEMKVVLWRLLTDFEFDLLDPDPPKMPGTRSQWPGSPCRVSYRRRRAAAHAAGCWPRVATSGPDSR
jgi:sterol 14alpha-demethylase